MTTMSPTLQPERILEGPIDQGSWEWADRVEETRQEQQNAGLPYPPKLDFDLLMKMPLHGEHALHQKGFWLDPKTVYFEPTPHYGLGIRYIVKPL